MPGTPTPHWPIRTAAPDDAEAIAALHRASILQTCASWYSAAQIRAWVELSTPELHREIIGQRRVRVALDDGAICGFSRTTIEDSLVNALYVAPFAMHRGVGQALLADCEEALLTAGRLESQLYATLNAVDFYAWLGYVAENEVQHRLPSGVALPAVAMRKRLV